MGDMGGSLSLSLYWYVLVAIIIFYVWFLLLCEGGKKNILDGNNMCGDNI